MTKEKIKEVLGLVLKHALVVADAASHLLNAILLGSVTESVSGRAHRTRSKWEKVINTLFFFDKDHCKVSHDNDVFQAVELVTGDK